MEQDPLKAALEAISANLDEDMAPVVAALLRDEPIEDAWEIMVQEVIDEA